MKKQSLNLLFILIIFQFIIIIVPNFHTEYSQNLRNNSNNINNNNVYSMINKSNDLNITMQFKPTTPIANEQTKILFHINHLNGTGYSHNLTAVVTILDTEGGLYKFAKQELKDGKVFINYIFPNNVSSKIIIQLYKNNQGYALASFDTKTPSFSTFANNKSNDFFSYLSKSISEFFQNFFK